MTLHRHEIKILPPEIGIQRSLGIFKPYYFLPVTLKMPLVGAALRFQVLDCPVKCIAFAPQSLHFILKAFNKFSNRIGIHILRWWHCGIYHGHGAA